MAVAPKVSAVIPTLGRSPLLVKCLEALRADGGSQDELEIVLVQPQGIELPAEVERSGLVDQHVHLAKPAGFAAATNAGIASATAPYIATVNDDAVVQPGWFRTLLDALENHPELGAVQGLNLQYGQPELLDGAGLAWNSWWQAVQLGYGEPVPAGRAPREVFGVSATAAIYRCSALEQVTTPNGAPFDERLHSYYEDAELAVRLRRGGWKATLLPTATVLHAGSTTSGFTTVRRWRWIHGNRWLAAAALLGKDFRGEIPRLLARDLRDLARATVTLQLRRVLGILLGWGRAMRGLGDFRHREPALDVRFKD